jgi:hypothetical protein
MTRILEGFAGPGGFSEPKETTMLDRITADRLDELVDIDPLQLRDAAIVLLADLEKSQRGGEQLGRTIEFMTELMRAAVAADTPQQGIDMLREALAEVDVVRGDGDA